MSAARKVWKSLKRNAGYGAALTMRGLIGALPAGAGLSVGERLGSLAYRLAGRDRRRALDSLAKAFGAEKPREDLERIALESFRNLGRSVAEVCKLWRRGGSAVQEVFDYQDGWDHLKALVSGGRGAVIVTAHLDNWELVGACSSAGVPVTVVGRRIYFEKYDRMVAEMRRGLGMTVIYQDESPRKLLRALKDNRVLALLADQDVPKLDGVFVPFLGRPAYTPTGPVSLAVTAKAPLAIGYGLRVGRNRHRLVISDPLEFDRSEKRRAVLEGTRLWSAKFEEIIRQHPEQWVWLHRRWRTKLNDRPEAARRSGYELQTAEGQS